MYGKIKGYSGGDGTGGSGSPVTWTDIQNKPTNLETTIGSQSKADTAESNAKTYADDLVAGIQSGEITWQDILNKPIDLETTTGSQTKATNALNDAKTYTDEQIALLPTGGQTGDGTVTWANVLDKPTDLETTGGSQAKATKALEDANAFTTTQIAAIPAPTWSSVTEKPTNLETTTGAQTKATTAENNAKAYTDQQIALVEGGGSGTGGSTPNLAAYGVVNDGVADDTAGLRAYIADMISKNKPIYIPGSANRYIISDQLLIQSPVVIYGDGDRTWIHSTIENKAPIKFLATSDCIIKDLKVSSMAETRTSSFQGAVTVHNCNHMLLENITVDGAAATGFFITGSNNIKVSNNRVMNTLADGIHTTSGSSYVIITENHCINTGDDSISVVAYQSQGVVANNVIIANNTVVGSHARGITNVGGETVKIANNTVNGTASCGIFVTRDATPEYNTYIPYDTTVIGNTVRNAGSVTPLTGNQNGIEVASSNYTKVIGNTVENSLHRGIVVINGANQVTLNDNDSNGNKVAGYLISSVSGVMAGVNRARNNSEQGFLMLNVTHSSFAGIHVYDSAVDVVNKHNLHVESCNNLIFGDIISMDTRTTQRIERAFWIHNSNTIRHGSLITNKGTRPFYTNTCTNISAEPFTMTEPPTVALFSNVFRVGQQIINTANSTTYMWNGTAWVTFVTA